MGLYTVSQACRDGSVQAYVRALQGILWEEYGPKSSSERREKLGEYLEELAGELTWRSYNNKPEERKQLGDVANALKRFVRLCEELLDAGIDDVHMIGALCAFLDPTTKMNTKDHHLREPLGEIVVDELLPTWLSRLVNDPKMDPALFGFLAITITAVFTEPVDDALLADQLVDSVERYVLCLTDEQFKALDLQKVPDMWQAVDAQIRHLPNSDAAADLQDRALEVLLIGPIRRALASPFLEKRRAAMNEMKRLVTRKGVSLDDQELVQVIEDVGVWDQLLGPNMHVQVLALAKEVVPTMARLQLLATQRLDMWWQAMHGQHESVRHALVELGQALLQGLDRPCLLHMDRLVGSCSPLDLEAHPTIMLAMALAKQLLDIPYHPREQMREYATVTLIFRTLAEPGRGDKWYLGMAWLSETMATSMPRIKERAHTYLRRAIELMGSHPLGGYGLCKFVIRALECMEGPQQQAAIKYLDDIGWRQAALDLFMACREIRRQGQAPPVMTIITNQTGAFWWGCGLDLLQVAANNGLDDAVLDALWDACIIEPVDTAETEVFLQWLARLLDRRTLPEGWLHHLFATRLGLMDPATMGSEAATFVHQAFLCANHTELLVPQGEPPIRMSAAPLDGEQMLWDLAFQARNEQVAYEALLLLIRLHLRCDRNMHPEDVRKLRMQFIDRCMHTIMQADAASQQGDMAGHLTVKALNALHQFIITHIEYFWPRLHEQHLEGFGGDYSLPVVVHLKGIGETKGPVTVTVSQQTRIYDLRRLGVQALHITQNPNIRVPMDCAVRLLHNKKELGVTMPTQMLGDVPLHSDSTVTLVPNTSNIKEFRMGYPDHAGQLEGPVRPAAMLWAVEGYRDILFGLLGVGSCAYTAWQLLQMCPVHPDLLRAITQLDPTVTLDANRPYLLRYQLHIMRALCLPSSPHEDWPQQLLQSGHLKRLVAVFEHMVDNPAALDPEVLSVLVDVLGRLLLVPKSADAPHHQHLLLRVQGTNLNPDHLGSLSLRLLQHLAHMGLGTQHTLVSLAGWVTAALRTSPGGLEAYVMREDGDRMSILYQLLLQTPSSGMAVRRALVGAFDALWDDMEPAQAMALHAHLRGMLRGLNAAHNNCLEYMELLGSGLKFASEEEAKGLSTICLERVDAQPTVEGRGHGNVDVYLLGLLTVLVRLLHTHTATMQLAKGHHLHTRMYEGLFLIPTRQHHGPFGPPQFKSNELRGAAAQLLATMCEDSGAAAAIADRMATDMASDDVPNEWNYSPENAQKADCGYVGLKNLGSTCYMNSILQQFFMAQSFRRDLLACPVPQTDDPKARLLANLQTIFARLQESERKFVDTRDFCSVYEYEGEPVNVSVQMDVDEFFNMLFDRLESVLKNTPEKDLLKRHFGGKLVQQVISKDDTCKHVSQRDEDFFALQCEVKGKMRIQESLQLYVEGERLVGENRYFCDTCKKKVDAVKRTCIAALPDTLIMHLKRFEFDMETMRRIKLNDFCQFPTGEELDMQPYMLEHLSSMEGTPIDVQRPPSYYKYRLAGVLVHMGTADSGHYYSYIRERGPSDRWLQFNDSTVEWFDPNDLADQTFGGRMSSLNDKDITIPKAYSAYMLFYERIEPQMNDQHNHANGIQHSQMASIPEDVLCSIWVDNSSQWRMCQLFDPHFTTLVSQLLQGNESHREHVLLACWNLLRTCRGKDRSGLAAAAQTLVTLMENVEGAGPCVLEVLITHPELIDRYLLMSPPHTGIRTAIIQVVCEAIDATRQDTSKLYPFVHLLIEKMPHLRYYIKSSRPYFEVLLHLAQINYTGWWLVQAGGIGLLATLYLGYDNNHPHGLRLEGRTEKIRLTPPEHVARVVDALLALLWKQRLPLPAVDADLLLVKKNPSKEHSSFVHRLIDDKDGLFTHDALKALCRDSMYNTHRVGERLAHVIGQSYRSDLPHHFAQMTALLEMEDSLHVARRPYLLAMLVQMVNRFLDYSDPSLANVQYLVALAETNPALVKSLKEFPNAWLKRWVECSSADVADECVKLALQLGGPLLVDRSNEPQLLASCPPAVANWARKIFFMVAERMAVLARVNYSPVIHFAYHGNKDHDHRNNIYPLTHYARLFQATFPDEAPTNLNAWRVRFSHWVGLLQFLNGRHEHSQLANTCRQEVARVLLHFVNGSRDLAMSLVLNPAYNIGFLSFFRILVSQRKQVASVEDMGVVVVGILQQGLDLIATTHHAQLQPAIDRMGADTHLAQFLAECLLRPKAVNRQTQHAQFLFQAGRELAQHFAGQGCVAKAMMLAMRDHRANRQALAAQLQDNMLPLGPETYGYYSGKDWDGMFTELVEGTLELLGMGDAGAEVYAMHMAQWAAQIQGNKLGTNKDRLLVEVQHCSQARAQNGPSVLESLLMAVQRAPMQTALYILEALRHLAAASDRLIEGALKLLMADYSAYGQYLPTALAANPHTAPNPSFFSGFGDHQASSDFPEDYDKPPGLHVGVWRPNTVPPPDLCRLFTVYFAMVCAIVKSAATRPHTRLAALRLVSYVLFEGLPVGVTWPVDILGAFLPRLKVMQAGGSNKNVQGGQQAQAEAQDAAKVLQSLPKLPGWKQFFERLLTVDQSLLLRLMPHRAELATIFTMMIYQSSAPSPSLGMSLVEHVHTALSAYQTDPKRAEGTLTAAVFALWLGACSTYIRPQMVSMLPDTAATVTSTLKTHPATTHGAILTEILDELANGQGGVGPGNWVGQGGQGGQGVQGRGEGREGEDDSGGDSDIEEMGESEAEEEIKPQPIMRSYKSELENEGVHAAEAAPPPAKRPKLEKENEKTGNGPSGYQSGGTTPEEE